MKDAGTPAIDVVAGVIRRADRAILIALRPQHLDQGGLWEFPGGKREPGESRFGALARELDEELGIEVRGAVPLIRLLHDYPRKRVHLDVWDVTDWRGTPAGREGQQLRWASPAALTRLDFPAANTPIITAVRAPRLLPFASAACTRTAEFLSHFERWLGNGLDRAVVDVSVPNPDALAQRIVSLGARRGAALHLAGLAAEAALPAGAGRHLDEEELAAWIERGRATAPGCSAGITSAAGWHLAEKAGADWLVVDPAATDDGAELLERLACSTLPAYRVCPFESDDVVRALRTGYQGVVLTDSALAQAPDDLQAVFSDFAAAAQHTS